MKYNVQPVNILKFVGFLVDDYKHTNHLRFRLEHGYILDRMYYLRVVYKHIV